MAILDATRDAETRITKASCSCRLCQQIRWRRSFWRAVVRQALIGQTNWKVHRHGRCAAARACAAASIAGTDQLDTNAHAIRRAERLVAGGLGGVALVAVGGARRADAMAVACGRGTVRPRGRLTTSVRGGATSTPAAPGTAAAPTSSSSATTAYAGGTSHASISAASTAPRSTLSTTADCETNESNQNPHACEIHGSSEE